MPNAWPSCSPTAPLRISRRRSGRRWWWCGICPRTICGGQRASLTILKVHSGSSVLLSTCRNGLRFPAKVGCGSLTSQIRVRRADQTVRCVHIGSTPVPDVPHRQTTCHKRGSEGGRSPECCPELSWVRTTGDERALPVASGEGAERNTIGSLQGLGCEHIVWGAARQDTAREQANGGRVDERVVGVM